MKKILLIILCIPFGIGAKGVEPASPDTTIVVNDKRIELRDGEDRLKVRVYEITEKDGVIEDEMVFEGHYRDGKSYERRKHSINIPLPTWKRSFDPHWAGFGMGFANFADGSLSINDVNGVSVRSGKSLEYNLNFFDKAFPLSRQSNFAFVTGLGIRWNRYRIDNNVHFEEIDGITGLHPAPEGITYNKSRLNTTSLTVPLLFEWQNRKKRSERFFLSAGIVGVVKTASSSRIVYKDTSGEKHKKKVDGGMNIRPVTMDILVQAGYRWIGFYAKYSPVEMFAKDKGPALHPVSVGFHLHWW